MPHPLTQKLADVRSRMRRRWVVYGVGRLVAVGLGAAVALGAIDYLVRLNDPGLRVMLSLALLAAIAWAAYRFVFTAWNVQLPDVDLARRLEKRFPQFHESLASAVEFLDQPEDDPVAGSAALRRAVITQATAKADEVDFAQAVDNRPAWRAGLTAAVVCLTAVVLAVLDPLATQVAVARLAYPLGDVTWPRKNYLMVRDRVERIARGQAFEIEVVDRYDGPLPSRVRIHYRVEQPDGTITEEVQPIRRLGQVMVARRENVTRPFSYRVEGGDDDTMGWTAVEVVEPPAVASLRATLIPPEYTGLPPGEGEGNLRVLAGTGVRFHATANKPLESARLCLEDGQVIPAVLSDDGLEIVVPAEDQPPIRITASGSYRFDLTDRQGVTSPVDQRWQIEAVPDRPPTVEVRQPDDTVYATAQAVVPFRVVAQDDLALARVELSARSDANAQDQFALPLWTGPAGKGARHHLPERPEGGFAQMVPGTFSAGRNPAGQRETIEYRWELEPLNLKPGDQMTIDVTATDYLGQSGASRGHRLVVVTPDELLERLAQQQRRILTELGRAIVLERQSRAQVTQLEIRLGELKQLDTTDIDRLRGAELTQRQATQVLNAPGDGVSARVRRLLADLENNRLDSPDIRRRMESLLDEIDRLDAGPLPAVARGLTAALKSAQLRLESGAASPGQLPDTETAGVLAETGRRQDEILAALDRMTNELAEWDDYRRFHRDVAQLSRDQQAVSTRTADVARHTLGKDLRDLPPGDVARLKVLGQEQLELARRLDQLLQQMGQTEARLADRDPLVAETLSDARQRANELGISGRMRAAGDDVAGNRTAQATRRQEQIAADLEEILDILANRSEDELVRLVKRLDQAQEDLSNLTKRQDDLRNRMDRAAATQSDAQRRRELNQLAGQQKELERQAQRLARRLQRLLAKNASNTIDNAAAQMGKAGTAAGQGHSDQARQQAGEAKKTLDKAAQELAERRRQAAADLATQQLTKLGDEIKALERRQTGVIEETRRLEGLHQVQGNLRPAQTDSLRQLAREQETLGQQTRRMGEKLSEAGVFHLALGEAADAMAQAAAWLDRGRTDASTQQPQEEALARLASILAALKPDPPGEQPNKPSSDGQGGAKGGPPRPPGERVPAVAQLKLLRAMQDELQRDTRAWQERFGQLDPLPEEARRQYERLSARQGRLADLMLQWVQPRPSATEEDQMELLEEGT
ncbi:MAG: hypothetical protein JW818_10120 [Pirellulales bacterium]|nr:hypothetical protein [Pirellulales bacterium]